LAKHVAGCILLNGKNEVCHTCILIWLVDKIQSEEIDKIISAEIPDQNIDQELYEIVTMLPLT